MGGLGSLWSRGCASKLQAVCKPTPGPLPPSQAAPTCRHQLHATPVVQRLQARRLAAQQAAQRRGSSAAQHVGQPAVHQLQGVQRGGLGGLGLGWGAGFVSYLKISWITTILVRPPAGQCRLEPKTLEQAYQGKTF